MGRIAITGTSSFLGGALLRRLMERHGADDVVVIDVASPPATLHGVRRRLLDFTEPSSDQRLMDALGEEEVRDPLAPGLLHQPPSRHQPRSRARVDRHPEPAGGGRRGRRLPRRDAVLHRGVRSAGPEPELHSRGPPAPAEPRSGLGARQSRGRAARGFLREEVQGAQGHRAPPRPPPGPGRAQLLHAPLRSPRGPRAHGVRSPLPAPAPRRCAPGFRGGGRAVARRRLQHRPEGKPEPGHGPAPGPEDPASGAAPRGLRGDRPPVGHGGGASPLGVRGLRALPVPRRRREGRARARVPARPSAAATRSSAYLDYRYPARAGDAAEATS